MELPKLSLAPFAPIPPVIAGPASPPKPMEAKAPKLAAATNTKALLKQVGVLLTDEQRKHLETHGFVLLTVTGTRLETIFEPPSNEKDEDGKPLPDYRSTVDEMVDAFDRMADNPSDPWSRGPGQAKLITPDLAMHAFHRFNSQLMEYLEQRQLRARLEKFLQASMDNAAALRKDAPEEVAARLQVIEAQLGTAWAVLGRETEKEGREPDFEVSPEVQKELDAVNPPTDPRTVAQRVNALKARLPAGLAEQAESEVARILKAESNGDPTLFSAYDPVKQADFTQFRPRSHYTKTEELAGYFRAMMYLGRNGYALNGGAKPATLGLTDTLLVTQVLARKNAAGVSPAEQWRVLMEITGFFAGQSDDLTFIETAAWIQQTLGRAELTLADATNPEVLAKLQAALGSLRPPQIISAERGRPQTDADLKPEFRIFGQRFSFDAWVLNRFITENLTMPSGLFIPAAFGDKAAGNYSQQFIKDLFASPEDPLKDFTTTLAKVRPVLDAATDDQWFGSLAGQQLHSLSLLAGERSANHPFYMRSPAFAAKNLESMLGHWTEIKHDTVLYAKQSYAEAGEGGESDKPLPPMPRGFVQPDLRFWREMERLAEFTKSGVKKHKLLMDVDEEWSPLTRFHTDMQLCRKLADKEARGESLTKDEYESIWTFSLSYMDNAIDGHDVPDADRGKSALITDVHTDAYRNEVLQEALGRPCVMIALVANEGAPRLVAGMAYHHFEFTAPADKRATDEEWRQRVYAEKPDLPQRAKWAVPVFTAKPDPAAKPKEDQE